ncbi:MAG TPA: ABC transporter ATP-binding protein [Alphaproteobacteria bacterium]|nr:ABC transporter ATP-binding protein [Alphaproteobacteria bacterium]
MADPAPALELDGVSAGYGETVVVDALSLRIAAGERVAVIGRNGVGKTTLLRAIVGRARVARGRIRLFGSDIGGMAGHRRAAAGLGYVPQEREIFPSLSVRENLLIARRPGRWTFESVCALFPKLTERLDHRGTQLSGGEQQMLAIGRALMGNPSVLLMDEPTEGLAPIVVEQLMAAIETLSAEQGITLVLVEQNARLALDFAPRTVVIDAGRIAYDGSSADLRTDEARLSRLVAVESARL